jgi:hypothetical protein
MPTSFAQDVLAPLLALPPIDRTRRNHGLEHATITLLSQKVRGLSMVGRSTPSGFYLHGEVSTDAVTEAVYEALRRMKAGETHLAVHPNCGTNFVTAGLAAGAAAFFGFVGAANSRERLSRLPIVTVLCTLALIFAQPLGLVIQRDVTTSGDMRDLQIVSITRSQRGTLVTHTVTTRD